MKRLQDTTDSLLSGGSNSAPTNKTTANKPNRNYRQKNRTKTQNTNTATTNSATGVANKGSAKFSPRAKKNNTRWAKKTNPPAANPKNQLRIIPLGGCEEVGRNMTVFEYGNDIVIIDMGLQFPEEDMHGIDYIIPNISYLKGKEKNVRAVIFSHGHLDHIGAAPILLEKLGNPTIVGRPLTLAMVKHKVEDYKKNSAKNLKAILIKSISDQFKFGQFTIKFFQMEHSIMDAVGVIIETPQGSIIHPGDWTLERDQNAKPILDYSHLSKIKRPTVLMLESLGAIDVRPSASHQVMKDNLNKLIAQAPGRLIIGTFASQIERIGWIIAQAEALGKKIALDGYSMKMNIEIAKELGYIKTKKETIIKIDQIHNYPDNKLLIIATGAQGEGNAVLSRIITGAHRQVKLKKSDTVVLSSSIIPGNENTIQRLKDGLYRQCDNVIHGELMDIHVSGHGNRNDIMHMLRTIKPDYFIPVYAYHYMLKESAKIAQNLNYKTKQVVVPENGSIIEFDRNGLSVAKQRAETDYVFVDGLGIGDVSNVVLRDRQMMAEDGMLVVIATISRKNGKLVSSPDIISRGFIYMKENKEVVEEIRAKVKQVVNECNTTKTSIEESFLKDKLRNDVGQFVFHKTKRRPMILPVVIEV